MYCGTGSSKGKRVSLHKVEGGYVCERHLKYYKTNKGKNKSFETFDIKSLKLKCECGFKEVRSGEITITKTEEILPFNVEMHCPECGKKMRLAKSQARIFRKQLRGLGEMY